MDANTRKALIERIAQQAVEAATEAICDGINDVEEGIPDDDAMEISNQITFSVIRKLRMEEP